MFIMELGGQLGIASSYLSQFASVIGDLSVSTNLGVEAASMQISRFMNIMGTATTDIDRMGASLVGLGNNSATTEADIMEMAMRIAGAGNQIGLTEAQVLGLAASLSSVGIEAQMGGSAISRTMSEIDVAVATGSDALDAWAEAAGMSSQAFAQAWEEDAAAALTQLFAGMEEAVSSGQSINLILQDLGVTELRQTDTLKRLTSASALMGRTMDIANVSWEENVALTNEAEQRYATTESRLLMLKNQSSPLPACTAVRPIAWRCARRRRFPARGNSGQCWLIAQSASAAATAAGRASSARPSSTSTASCASATYALIGCARGSFPPAWKAAAAVR